MQIETLSSFGPRFLTIVSIAGGALYREIDRDRPADSEKLKVFHQWKATTASLLSTLGPHNGRDDKITEIVEELETWSNHFDQSCPGTPFTRLFKISL